MEKMICVPLGSEFDIKCPTGQPRILISSHYDCPTFIRLGVLKNHAQDMRLRGQVKCRDTKLGFPQLFQDPLQMHLHHHMVGYLQSSCLMHVEHVFFTLALFKVHSNMMSTKFGYFAPSPFLRNLPFPTIRQLLQSSLPVADIIYECSPK